MLAELEFSAADTLRDAIYSWDTWIPVLKLMVPIAIAGIALLVLKVLLNALARYINSKKKLIFQKQSIWAVSPFLAFLRSFCYYVTRYLHNPQDVR